MNSIKAKKIKFISYIVISSILLGYNSIAQPGICPPHTSDWHLGTATYEQMIYMVSKNFGSVDYKWQNIGSNVEVFVDWNTFINNSDFFNIPDRDLKEYLIFQIIFDRLPCPFEGSRNIAITEVVPCKIKRNCYIQISSTQEFDCIPEYWPGNPPQFMNIGQEKYIVESLISDCGFSCCKTIYTVSCSEASGTQGTSKPIVYNIFKETIPGSICSEYEVFYDCKTNEPVECKSICE